MSFLQPLLGNLRAGLKLLTLRPVAANEFAVSFDQLAALLALDLALLVGVDWLSAAPAADFDPYNFVYSWMVYILAGFWAAALIARMQGAQAHTRTLLVVWLATVPAVIVFFGVVLVLPVAQARPMEMLVIAAAILVAMSALVVRRIFGSDRFGALAVIVAAGVGLPWFLQSQLYIQPRLWSVPQDEAAAAADSDSESLLFEQPDRIADAIETLAPERPGVVDTYFVGFAGWGAQRVFRNEALFGENALTRHFHSTRRALELINDVTDRDTYPLATVSGLRYALQLLGERLDKEDDVLVLLLTSHGSREEGIAVGNGSLPLVDLQPEDLRNALDDSGITWRVVIVSACYAGVFIDPLKSDNTLVITAADARHTSFGCADDRDLTYFGEAFLRDALPGAPSLEAAFAKARKLIVAREAAEKLTPSNPQIFVGPAIRQKLARPAGPPDTAPESTATDANFTARRNIPAPHLVSLGVSE